MRVVIVGVGAVGGTVAARMELAGYDVLAVARGAHGAGIRDRGLAFESPTESQRVTMPVAESVGGVDFRPDDVVLLGMKSQDTAAVLGELRLAAPPETPIVCLQNGVDNERQALRLFPNVYGVCVMLPADHLEPGRVRVYANPTPGILDLGRYPHGTDAVVDELAAAFTASGFESVARPDIMRWKYRKLLMNLGNAIEALVGGFASWPSPGELAHRVAAEGEAVLTAAGIDVVSEEEDRARRGDVLRIRPVDGVLRDGGSTYQSLQRGAPVETDYLTGEIVLLGRLHGVPTPANALLQRILAEAAARGEPPAGHTEDELLAALGAPAAP
jgi:2-dehydropantoate 2-reductase